MNDTDTADLVRRIVGTWPMAPKGFLWTEAVSGMDYTPALATFVQLRDELDEQRISIARFRAVYHGIVNRGNTGRRHDTEQNHDRPAISFAEYLDRLAWRMGTGDPEAAEMIDIWQANAQRGAVFAPAPEPDEIKPADGQPTAATDRTENL